MICRINSASKQKKVIIKFYIYEEKKNESNYILYTSYIQKYSRKKIYILVNLKRVIHSRLQNCYSQLNLVLYTCTSAIVVL
jgi:hypothetical protein